jgi:hypothetical protein
VVGHAESDELHNVTNSDSKQRNLFGRYSGDGGEE